MAAGNSNTGLNGTLFGVDTTGNGIINQTQALPLIFSTSNTERMRLESGGNLAFSSTAQRITGDMTNATLTNRLAFQTSTANGNTTVLALPNGTSTTSQFLAFNTADPTNSSNAALVATSTAVRLSSGQSGTGSYLPLTFFTNGSEQARLDTSGNLGIGTSSPGAPLNVKKNSAGAVVEMLRLTNDGPGAGSMSKITFDASGTAYAAITGGFGTGGPQIKFELPTATSGSWDWIYQSTTLATLLTSGNLGIGTSSPAFRLDVLTGVEGDSIRLNNNNANIGAANTFGFVVAESGSARVNLRYRRDGSGSAELYNVSNGPFVFGTNNTERARIDANGNIVAGASAALATTATNGFLYVPTCAGTPTGTPTAITGMAPIVVNTTNNKLYFYSGGAWRDAGP
jgi:hypothetical protein